MGWRGWTSGGHRHKIEVDPKKKTFFVTEKYIDDVKQDEKHVPDLLESIMRPSGLVKEELRPILFKLNGRVNLDPKSQKSRFQLFGSRKSDGFPPEANASLLASKFWAQIDPSRPNKSKKCGFLALAGAFHSSSKNLHVPKWPDCLINPHQRCVYSDSPFARKDTFVYFRVQKWVGGS